MSKKELQILKRGITKKRISTTYIDGLILQQYRVIPWLITDVFVNSFKFWHRVTPIAHSQFP